MSGEDPRWAEIRALDERLFADIKKANIDGSGLNKFSSRRKVYEALVRVLESIAWDKTLPPRDRDLAEKRLVTLRKLSGLFPPPLSKDAIGARMFTSEVIQTLSEMVADESADRHSRERAQRRLTTLAEQLRAQGSDISQIVAGPEKSQ